MKIFGCGDLFIAKRLPQGGYNGFKEVSTIIKSHDVCFGNLETTVHDNEGYPSKFPGGGYAMCSPLCLNDVKSFGFNALNIANNHTLDYCHKGLEATIENLMEYDISFFGAGMNLIDASRPKYVDCKDGRVAFIGVTSSFHDSDAAGPAGGIIPGRPGVNPLRRIEYYELTHDLYHSIENIAEVTGMNDSFKWSIANGYRKMPKGVFLREMNFVEADNNGKVTHPLDEDMNRIRLSIREASVQADCVVVSIHSHQMDKTNDKPAQFIKEFSHECIDAGAHVVFGHGAHELRGLELYKQYPIFYGLGDFILHNEMQEVMPQEFYLKLNCDYSEYDHVGLAMINRSKNGTIGLHADRKAWESVGVGIDFIEGMIKKISIYPIELGYENKRTSRGWPEMDKSGRILERFRDISMEYGTGIDVVNNTGYVQL